MPLTSHGAGPSSPTDGVGAGAGAAVESNWESNVDLRVVPWTKAAAEQMSKNETSIAIAIDVATKRHAGSILRREHSPTRRELPVLRSIVFLELVTVYDTILKKEPIAPFVHR
jgi:hypothetical protein